MWRDCGLPEHFLGNGGTNHKLVAFAERFRDQGWKLCMQSVQRAIDEQI
jgi:hypothetical protein